MTKHKIQVHKSPYLKLFCAFYIYIFDICLQFANIDLAFEVKSCSKLLFPKTRKESLKCRVLTQLLENRPNFYSGMALACRLFQQPYAIQSSLFPVSFTPHPPKFPSF
ncbi:hypothetical protein P3X46_031599 [Hevea brasiliensis]|uniref:Uncharacterized protein n=1 Tax=Hevea brasiliensis TaxID=3981 RepID=A0ABQ9KKU7_HEVBR|nr:hypothetical protein P3X46_031599 [Hevea brasiliensis]